MQDYDLPSPDIGSAGLALRRVVAKNISSLEVVALSYPNGKHPGAAKLRQFFLSCAAALGNGVIVDPEVPIVLIPNPAGAATRMAGPMASLDRQETNSYAHYISARVSGAVDGASISAMVMPDGTAIRSLTFYPGNANRISGSPRTSAGINQGAGGSPLYMLLPNNLAIQSGDVITQSRDLSGKVIYTLQRGTDAPIEIFSYAIGGLDTDLGRLGTGVAINARNGTVYSDVEFGPYAVPLRIDSTVMIAGYKPQVTITYTGSPDAYEMQLMSPGGGIIRDWSTAVVSLSSKGAATLTAANGIPTSEFGTIVTVNIRQKNLPTVTKSTTVTMPAGKARLGMNVTKATESAGERIFKDMTMYNDGYRSGSAYLNTSEWIDSNNNLIKHPGTETTYAFCRCDVPGSRCEVTWEGGDDPALDIGLSEGTAGVSYGNVVQSGRSIQFDFNHSWDAVGGYGRIRIKRVNPANPVRNLRVKEVATSWSGGVFADAYIARMAKYSYLRLMDVMGSNGANGLYTDRDWTFEWSDRSTPSNPRKLGWPLEWVIELANRTGADIWTMVPAGSSPDFDKKLVRGLFYGELMDGGVKLDAARTVYDEKGNEWFNSSFSIYHNAAAAAKAFGRVPETTPENDARIAEMAYRIQTHWTAIDGQFPAGRLKKVLAGSPENLYEANILWDNYNVRNFDIYSSAYYFFNIQFANNPSLWPGADVNALLSMADSSIPRGLATVQANRDWAKARGKGFWVYEGQQHWFEPTKTAPYYDEALNKQFQQAPGLEPIFRKWISSWTANFDGGLTMYLAVGPVNLQFGSWGFIENQGPNALANAPKQRALNAAMIELAGS